MTIFKQQRSTYKHDIKSKAGGDKATADSVLELLFGTYHNGYESEYVVTWEGSYSKQKTVWNRIAYLIILPIFLLCAPFQWFFTGSTGISKNKSLGRFILKLTGDYTEDE